ncbi:hypothetical protein [Rhodospirillum centenum]|uniref:Mor transcription activator domain-containing protein n=1 Tax=Rhodospirillum centenum (strain ATCC 51521 / SW) TaxID=414684 RepID=B6IMZ4_RHOCS|nr:hypothetical protein [Rhodospirillum centenum]ACI98891.1 phage-related hypothetical protein [Rhodospirillum centenum SW]
MCGENVNKRRGGLDFELRRNFYGETTRLLLDALGDKAEAFMVAFGGGEGRLIPAAPHPDHPFVSVIGLEKMRALVDALGGERVYIPTVKRAASRKFLIAQAIMRNEVSRSEMARCCGVTARYVRMVAREMEAAGVAVPPPMTKPPHRDEPE